MISVVTTALKKTHKYVLLCYLVFTMPMPQTVSRYATVKNVDSMAEYICCYTFYIWSAAVESNFVVH